MNTSAAISHTGASDFANAMSNGGGDGSETLLNGPTQGCQVGSDFDAGAYIAAEAFLDFDTTAVTSEPGTVTLVLTLSGETADPVSDLIVATLAWGGNPASGADWQEPSDLAALTEVGRKAGSAFVGLDDGDTVSITIDTAAVVVEGRTQFVLFTENMAAPTTDPTGFQDIVFYNAEEADPPELTISGGALDPPPDPPDPVTIRVVDINGDPHTASGLTAGVLPLARCESITRQKNLPTEAVIVFPKYAYDRDDVHLFADDSGTGDLHELQVIRNGIIRFYGPAISADTDSNDGEVALNCRGLDWYFTRRFIDGQRTNELTNPSFETGDETGWTTTGAATSTVTTDDAIRGTHSLRLASLTPLGNIYEEQTVSVTGTGVGTFLTVVFYFKIESSLGGHAFDRRGLYVEANDGATFKSNNYYPIDQATPTGEWIRAKTTIAVDPGETWDITVRLYSPPGSILWDDGQMVAMQSVSTASITGNTFEPVDVSEIVGLIQAHVQDPAVGKSDLNIGTDVSTVGVSQVKHIQWADHISWLDQMSEWLDRDDCFDCSIRNSTREFVIHVPQMGTDRRATVTLAYPGNIGQYEYVEDGGGTITDDTELDDDTGDGPDREEGHYADASLIGGLTCQAVNAAPTKTEPSGLDPIARETVNRARRPAQLLTITLRGADLISGTPYDELLGVNDAVTLDVVDGWITVDGFGRISQITEFLRDRRLELTIPVATP